MAGNHTKRVRTTALLAVLVMTARADLHGADASLMLLSTMHNPAAKSIPLGDPRQITRVEILRAIKDALARREISWGSELGVDDLTVQALVPGIGVEGTLRVKSIRLDRLRGRLVFELWAPREPQYLPVAVTTPISREWNASVAGTRIDWDRIARVSSAITGRKACSVRSAPPVLVRPGATATLVMRRPNARVTTVVRALQPGAKGQSILVREVNSMRVMTAEVVDQTLLQMTF